ncbi:MAG: beta-N-acetylhexosaminidase [Cryobacterium sp.]|nr:beta-N-acetylhexosaminidase [Cryobacterium sp.]
MIRSRYWLLVAIGILAISGVVLAVMIPLAVTPYGAKMQSQTLTVTPEPVSRLDAPGSWMLPTSLRINAASGSEQVAQYLADTLDALGGLQTSLASAGEISLSLEPGQPSEGYSLSIGQSGVNLSASTEAGLFWGVQTLRQLLSGSKSEGWSLPNTKIIDYPRFAYRGAMLDVARHFFSVDVVKKYIDDIVLLKLNALHLHLTDDQGWRIAINGWPNLTDYGAKTQVDGGGGGYYSQADYKEIVDYAASRFVTIVPEIDLPGHTNAALASYPELNCDGKAPELYEGIKVGFSSLCVDKELTYEFLQDVLSQIAKLTPGPYLHIGGDEALSTPEADYLKFIARVSKIASETGKTVIGWHEMGKSKELPEGTIGQYWSFTTPREDAAELARQFISSGGKLILSPANAIYLDIKYDESSQLGLVWADGPTSLRRSYEWEPLAVVPGIEESQILGVEAPLWTETVKTLSDIETMAFPRIASAAQKAWSPKDQASFDAFAKQVANLGTVLERLGIKFEKAAGVDWH